MAEPPPVQFKLEQTGDQLEFASPEALRAWSRDTFNYWQWITGVPSPFQSIVTRSLQNFNNQLEQVAGEWTQNKNNADYVKTLSQKIASIFTQNFSPPLVIPPNSPASAFINSVREKSGDAAAPGAYTFLVRAGAGASNFPQPEFFRGFIDGFLFKNDIDWTAKSHQEVLDALKKTYAENIAQQNERARELENRNNGLNQGFESTLTEKKEALDKLHEGQTAEFRSLIEKHETDLKALIETYDQKLALQKPVAYWEKKEKYHSRFSKVFGFVALFVGITLLVGMGLLIHWIFGDLKTGQSPEHWQIGILAAGAFFAVWCLRILLRLFFSHVHLASDAAERRTMILTYLALAREGAEVGPEDRKLILQHLFRTAADGLVRDDATPPSIFEIFTRTK